MIQITVSHLSRTLSNGYKCGSKASLVFVKDGSRVHTETFVGKCLTKYVRHIESFDYDVVYMDCNEETNFFYEVKKI